MQPWLREFFKKKKSDFKLLNGSHVEKIHAQD